MRYTYDNNYFNDPYQGIPVNGYNEIIDKLLDGIEVRTDVDYLANRAAYDALAEKSFIQVRLILILIINAGELEYRSLRFETEVLDTPNYQGVAVVNYTDRENAVYAHHRAQALRVRHAGQDRHHARVPGRLEARRRALLPHQRRQERGPLQSVRGAGGAGGNVIFAGRLGGYKYYDMDKAIAAAFDLVRNELGVEPTEA